MVAVIKTGASIHRIFTYNEQKVKEGVAYCIWAANYPKDLESLTAENKLNRLLNQAALNDNVKRNSVHISLNFNPAESHLSGDQLRSIADAYMQKIGFGEQPYLVYQHLDAGHPHMHVVSIKIRRDGSRIDTQNIGRNASQKAIKEIERAYGLLQTGKHMLKQENKKKQLYAARAQYGKKETKSAISSVVQWVFHQYKYTSLEALNAALRQFGVVADRGSEGSRIYQHNGLVYRIIDAAGNKKGVPIKASDLQGSPTLAYLEQKFRENEAFKKGQAQKIKILLDWTLASKKLSYRDFFRILEKERINVLVPPVNQKGGMDITYIDHRTGCVFEDMELGEKYSLRHLEERFGYIEHQLELTMGQKKTQNKELRQVQEAHNKTVSFDANSATENTSRLKKQEIKLQIKIRHL